MAVPMTVKMPEPITAPMPRAVSDHGPSDFLSACSGSSDSRISLSMDFRASSCLSRAVLLVLSLDYTAMKNSLRRSLHGEERLLESSCEASAGRENAV
jgi:hypothetical protein